MRKNCDKAENYLHIKGFFKKTSNNKRGIEWFSIFTFIFYEQK